MEISPMNLNKKAVMVNVAIKGRGEFQCVCSIDRQGAVCRWWRASLTLSRGGREIVHKSLRRPSWEQLQGRIVTFHTVKEWSESELVQK